MTHKKGQYFAVRWGDAIRISDKVDMAGAACRDCYGMVSANMEYVALGTTKAEVRKKRTAGLETLTYQYVRHKDGF